MLGPAAPRDLVPGDFVKVEADRGEDLGVVLSKTRMEDFEEVMPTAGYRGRGFASGQGERKCILRLASPDERAAVLTKVYDEEVALQTIREKIADRGFVMSILDAEYQFDRHKLTFYFEADHRIDFRELVSELFSHYKTRIWMQQVDTSAVDPHDPGTELAKMSGLLPDRGEESISAQSSLSGITTEHRSHNSSFSAWPETDHLAPVSTDSYAYNVYRPCPPAAEQRGQDYHGGYAGYETSTSSASWLRY
ncbi:hypothetical protein EON64_08185 [archaeon]|nr:MAG: hypothetical protein EON64_08185 [archaeon]